MKERPILMSAPMVRACLDGSKTQTRHIAPVESFDIKDAGNEMVTWAISFSKAVGPSRSLASYSGGRYSADDATRIVASQFCPYGKPGDHLWVREAHQVRMISEENGNKWHASVAYRADDAYAQVEIQRATYQKLESAGSKSGWTPGIHMFRWACRLELEITGVRVERLQDISEGDSIAEGCREPACGPDYKLSKKWAYRELWNDINGAGAWDANPWVWVVEFKRVKP